MKGASHEEKFCCINHIAAGLAGAGRRGGRSYGKVGNAGHRGGTENEGDFFEEWSELKAVYDAIPLDEIENDPNYYVRGVKKFFA